MGIRQTWISGMLLALTLTGCEPPSAQFANNNRVSNLIPEAQLGITEESDGELRHYDGVIGTLDGSFGTPENLIAWMKLPIDFGQLEGTVAESPADVEIDANQFYVAFDGEQDDIITDKQLLLNSGEYEDTILGITRYDAETGLLTVNAEFEDSKPAAGDRFVIVGQVLQYGRELYMTHCLHCHGTTGDGNGPTAEYLNPRPRDFRLGLFKFTSTNATTTKGARRDDLEHVIRQGVPGTYMPSFLLLKDDELHAIVEYVRFLSMRGQYENDLVTILEGNFSEDAVKSMMEGGTERSEIIKDLLATLKEDFLLDAADKADNLARFWEAAEDESALVIPGKPRTPDTPESRARGRQLYLSAKAKCTNCHGVAGLGNGPQTFEYETDPTTNEKRPAPGLHDDWGNLVKPRNLTTGIYRGGRRPLDIYRRIRVGIKGAKMPAFGGTVLSDDEVWDLVNYVMSIPYEGKDAAPVAGRQPAEEETGHSENETETQTNNPTVTQDQVAQQSGSGEGR